MAHTMGSEIAHGMCATEGVRWQPAALMALQEAGEAYLVGLFEDCVSCARWDGCLTKMMWRPPDFLT